MVEGARLESVYTRKGIAGSNPALSADESTWCFRLCRKHFLFPGVWRVYSPKRTGIKNGARSAAPG